jgi:hypothetical protein
MVPVPHSGIFERLEGLEQAEKTSGVAEIRITARLRDYVAAWRKVRVTWDLFLRGVHPRKKRNPRCEPRMRSCISFFRRDCPSNIQ